MPYSVRQSQSPIGIKEEREYKRRERDAPGRRGERKRSDRGRDRDDTRRRKYLKRNRDDDYDDVRVTRIKEEPVDSEREGQRQERLRYDEQRRDDHYMRLRDGNYDFSRSTTGGDGVDDDGDITTVKKEKEKPSFEPSGKLADETNTYRGVVVKYSEPPEARKPKRRWRLYAFKGETALPTLQIHRQSAYLLGRDRIVADIPTDHPSCSKQHAVLQFRMVVCEREEGGATARRRVAPYVIDLDSANGTYVNNERVESRRYYELREKDVLKFGYSSREYVLLHDTSDTSEVLDEYDAD